MRCIAVINQKGGVGKTTSTVNIGAAVARAGHRVLLLDMDPQANMSLHLDRQPVGEAFTMTDLLVDDVPIAKMLHSTATEGLFIVPADTSLSGVETMLVNRIGRETILRDAIELLDADESVEKFDFIFLDCPPSLGVLSANALVAAGHVIVPMQAEYFSMQGMTKLLEVMQLVKKALNPTLDIGLILPCMVDRRTNLTGEVLSELETHFGHVLAETCIRSNVKLAEAPSFGRTIFEHAPESNGAHDYAVVADELLRRHAGTFVPAPPEEEEDDEEEWEYEDEDEEEESELAADEDSDEEDDEDEEEDEDEVADDEETADEESSDAEAPHEGQGPAPGSVTPPMTADRSDHPAATSSSEASASAATGETEPQAFEVPAGPTGPTTQSETPAASTPPAEDPSEAPAVTTTRSEGDPQVPSPPAIPSSPAIPSPDAAAVSEILTEGGEPRLPAPADSPRESAVPADPTRPPASEREHGAES